MARIRRFSAGKVKGCLNSRNGTTLVELIVAFVLTAILMTAAIATISPATKVFNKVVGMSRAQGVTDILLEEIGGQLEPAERIGKINADSISYTDKNGQGVNMKIGSGSTEDGQELDGMLVLEYDKENVFWYLPQKTYMGFRIESIQFQQLNDKNFIEVQIEIKNGKSDNTYKRTKVIECYKVGDGPIGS